MLPTYIPNEYWLKRGKVYKEQFKYNKKFQLQENMLIDYLKTALESFDTVLELGCGFGRISRLMLSKFPDIKEYVAVDLSPDQIENAKQYTKLSNDGAILKFIVSDIQSLDIDKKYDLVISCEVLLHILPSEIGSVIKKMVNMSNKHIVNIDWFEEVIPKKVAPHNFIHQYQTLYKSTSLVKQVYRVPIVSKGLLFKFDTKQSIFHALKE